MKFKGMILMIGCTLSGSMIGMNDGKAFQSGASSSSGQSPTVLSPVPCASPAGSDGSRSSLFDAVLVQRRYDFRNDLIALQNRQCALLLKKKKSNGLLRKLGRYFKCIPSSNNN